MTNITRHILRKVVKKIFRKDVEAEINRLIRFGIIRYLEKYTSDECNLLDLFNDNAILINNHFKVLDIGCSGGIDEYWKKNKYIDICGIDSAKEEIDKLKNINKNKNIQYYNYFIEPKPENIKYKKYIYPGKSLNFSDTGAWRFQKYGIESKDQKIFGDKIYPFFHNTDEKLKNVKKITIDDFCKEKNFNNVNFLKIDTDGHSLKVLNSGSKLLNNKNLLGIKVEVSFSNKDVDDFYLDICHLLTKHNFQLLRIMPRRYEPYYLPDKFIYNFAAQNLGGFDEQGDIIFTRNLDSETINSLDYETFLKFLILLETFELSGLAIKLIKLSEHKLLDEEVSEKFINILTKHTSKKITGQELDHKSYINKIMTKKELIFPEK